MLPIKKQIIIIIPLLILLLGCHKTKQVSSEEITTITINQNQNIIYKINQIQIIQNLTTIKNTPNPNYIYYTAGENLSYENLSLKKEKLQVAYIQNYKFCIYNNEKITQTTLKDCNFIYIYANKNKENSIDFSHINKDFVCWINIENTNIDYPVVQSKDNSYYLHRDIYGNYLYAGTTFLDYRDYYDDSKNLIIYGHNMKNTTMFSELEKFKKEDFFNSNPTITLTNKNGERHFKAFAVLLVDKNYDYRVTDFKNDEEYNKFLNKICDESMFKVKNKPTSSDKIMTLTTCSYEFKNARTVVICKEIDN